MTERRRHPRHATERAVKLFHAPSLRYAQGRTIDLGEGGLLIETPLTRAVLPGDAVRIAIDFDGRGVVASDAMRCARVVRAEPQEAGTRRIAIAFEEPMELAA